MTVEIPLGIALVAVGVVLLGLTVDAALVWLLREARQERDDAKGLEARYRREMVAVWGELVALKEAKPGAEPAKPGAEPVKPLPSVADAGPEVESYVLTEEPVRGPAELERLQPLALEALAGHGNRERREAPPPIQPEPVAVEVLEPVEVKEGDDDPPRDASRPTGRGDETPGGRALTPFAVGGGYRYPWGSAPARPPGVLPEVRPTGELPADWQRPFYRAVAYLKAPIEITRLHPQEWWPGFISGRRVVRSHRRPLFAGLRRVVAG